MALHSTLPIYKVTYQLLALAGRITQHLPRNARAMGAKMNDECLELVILIYRANSAINKVPHLDELLERLQVAELLFRVAVDLRLIAQKHYADAIELTAAIGKQANGWRKYSAKSPAA
jgi:predicted GTPase